MRGSSCEVNRAWAALAGRRRRTAGVQRLSFWVAGERSFIPAFSRLSVRVSSLSSVRIVGLGEGGVAVDSSSGTPCEGFGGGGMDGAETQVLKEDGSKKQQAVGKCGYWLAKKRRFCASHALPGLQYVAFFSFCNAGLSWSGFRVYEGFSFRFS